MKSVEVSRNWPISVYDNYHGGAHKFTEKGDIFIHMETEHKNTSTPKAKFRRIEYDVRTKLKS